MGDTPPLKEAVSSASRRSALLGAIFLMATSAIGPGFITQTATFTVQLGAAFACAIVLSILVDVAVQLNVWRVIGVAGRRAHELAGDVAPGAGWLLAGLVVVGGFVFNIGNVAGAGLGLDALLGLDPRWGGALSAVVAAGIFLSARAGVALDRVVVVLGMVMIVATATIAVTSGPPVGDALRNVVAPTEFDVLAVTTIIGGTVGGYITYAGAHRLLDSGTTGPEAVRAISRSSVVGILVTGLMRVVLFLAILGVIAGGTALDESNPAASAFEAAAGEAGLRVFGLILWAAALTSVIGAAYTSISFVTTSATPARTRNLLTVGFIAATTVVYLVIEQAPVTLLVFAGAFNGMILPIGFGLLLWIAWRRRDLLHGYRYPRWLLAIGVLAWLLTLFLAWRSFTPLMDL
ncbi:divalent metal cation transporter [Nocardioides sp. ChNu-153]|uniref:NRAMP family divalent metal transporter n=1 Tax=unclassified Nocardioides TaxID=2615069 RepID=UPI002406C9F2|nr:MULTISPECIES: NRAMP family divalent metal transporter [unclassified Nocardioides]MDF9717952.1 divalent metal cation transporter [Nocardioides sp. ChNu-99]MDN7120662.1 divalent metal cation transporter [Nocardioides sp. ChNu-153]